MKRLEEFVLEKLKVGKIKTIYHPNSKKELIDLIIKEIETNGPNCSLNHIDVSNIDDMSSLFLADDVDKYTPSGHPILSKFDGDISNWDVSNVKNMEFMFGYSNFNGDISDWNVSNVTKMFAMFAYSKFSGDISNWDVSNVTEMTSMFNNSNFDGDISNWDVSNVTDMAFMFYGSTFTGKNSDISNWDVSNVTEITWMFRNSSFSGDISKWKINPKAKEHINKMFDGSPLENNPPYWYK